MSHQPIYSPCWLLIDGRPQPFFLHANGRGCFWNISVLQLISAFTKGNLMRIPLRNCPARIGYGCFTIVPTLYTRVNVSVSVKCSMEAEWKDFIPKYDVCHLKSRLASAMTFAVPLEWQHIKTHQKMRLRRRFFRFGPNLRWCFLFQDIKFWNEALWILLKGWVSNKETCWCLAKWRCQYSLVGRKGTKNNGITVGRHIFHQTFTEVQSWCVQNEKNTEQSFLFWWKHRNWPWFLQTLAMLKWVGTGCFFELIPNPRVFVYLSGFDKALVLPFSGGDLDYQLRNGHSQELPWVEQQSSKHPHLLFIYSCFGVFFFRCMTKLRDNPAAVKCLFYRAGSIVGKALNFPKGFRLNKSFGVNRR